MSAPKPPADLDELRKAAARADRAWQSCAAAGGLVTLADIAARWGVDRGTVRGYRNRREDFPEPVATIGPSEVWTTAAIDLWRATPRPRGRPPKNPKA